MCIYPRNTGLVGETSFARFNSGFAARGFAYGAAASGTQGMLILANDPNSIFNMYISMFIA